MIIGKAKKDPNNVKLSRNDPFVSSAQATLIKAHRQNGRKASGTFENAQVKPDDVTTTTMQNKNVKALRYGK
jgi:hypothetical protein